MNADWVFLRFAGTLSTITSSSPYKSIIWGGLTVALEIYVGASLSVVFGV